MSRFDDDPDDMTQPPADDFDDHQVEALLRGTAVSADQGLVELLLLVRSVGETSAPQPSAALAALFSDAPAAAPQPTMDPRWRRRLAAVALLSTGTSATLVGAAAANVLPQRAQQVIARVVNEVSPLTLPGSHPARHHSPRPAPLPTTQPPTAAPLPIPSTLPTTGNTPVPTRSAEPTEESGHATPQRSGRPTALPSQANGQGEDHRRPTPRPTSTTGKGHDGRAKGGSGPITSRAASAGGGNHSGQDGKGRTGGGQDSRGSDGNKSGTDAKSPGQATTRA